MIRIAIALALALGASSLFSADDASAKAVNTVCVACGAPVDAKVAPVAAKTKEGKDVLIGCCSDKCAAEVKKNPAQYADAAVMNKAWKAEEIKK